MMKKMTLMIAAYDEASAQKVIRKAKEILGLKKGARVLSANGVKAVFVSGLIQKHYQDLRKLDKYKDYEMLIIPAYPESFQVEPNSFAAKVYVNNTLNFSVFVCGVKEHAKPEDVNESAEYLAGLIRNNFEL